VEAPCARNGSTTGGIPSSANLVLATLTGSSTVVLRDITNLASPVTLCTFADPIAPHFAMQTVVGYLVQGSGQGSPGRIVRLDLASGMANDVANWPNGGFGSGTFDWSPDGRSLTYIVGSPTATVWHLIAGGHDQVLANLPAVPGRGVSQLDDDFMLAFSPDGLYLALVQTFATGGSGGSPPDQDPGSGVSVMQSSLRWTRPHASPDGRWVAYTTFDSANHPHVALYSVQGNSVGPAPIGLRSGAQFLNNSLFWYQEEVACDCGLTQSQLTGRTFIYDIAAATESPSRISGLLDAWPRVTAPPSLGG